MNIAQLLKRSALSHASRPAIAVGQEITADYAGLARRASKLADHLRNRLSLLPGERIAVAMKNCPQYLEVLYGIWWAGLAAVPMNAKLHAREFAYMLSHSGARLCFGTADLEESLSSAIDDAHSKARLIVAGSPDYDALFSGEEMAPLPAQLDDLAWLFYTSGTTGRPKGAMLSHGNLLAMTSCYFADVDTVQSDDCLLHAAPMSHGVGLYNFPFVAQAGLHIVPESGGYDPAEVFDLLEHYPRLCSFFAPTLVKRLIDHPGAQSARHENLKTIVYGGAPMYVADLKRAMEVFGNRFVQIYGQGESPMTISSLTRAMHGESAHPRYEARLASAGRAQTLVELRIADEDDHPLPTGETGEIQVRGLSVMPGYWNDPAATAKTLRGGWLHTGDLGSLDEEGFLTLKDRSKDVIISGGTNIYPREVEEVLLRHPRVKECSVLGRPHADWGEEVVAFVVAQAESSLSETELDALCLEEIARFKRPKAYYFVDALPKNNYGKILKTSLREMLAAEGA